MVEADSHLKLLPTFIFDLYKVIDLSYVLSIGIWQQPYTVLPTVIGSYFGVLGHLWLLSQFDLIMPMIEANSQLKLLPPSI
jgi:hypothetical protein